MALYAAPTGIRMILHVKSYALKYMISGNFFSQANLQVKTRQRLFVNFNFRTSVKPSRQVSWHCNAGTG